VASYYTDPAAKWGLVPASTGSYTAASPLNVTLTAAGAAVFPYLNAANAIPVAGQGTTAIKAYLGTPTAATNETTTPLLTAGAYTVGVTHTTASGEQILALTMDNTPTLLHSQAFAYGVINWVTNGVFLGSRQVYLNPEIDDLLLGNWIYAPALHPGCEPDNTCPTYFETGADLQAMANWQAGVQSQPQFQSYRGTYGVNGVGTTWFDPTDPVFAAIKSLNSQFWWLSHTWDHSDLDCYSTTNSGACVPATLAQSLAELNQDIAVAPSLGIPLDQIGMVTPFNSGLSNADFLQAAAQVGIQYIVYPQLPASPNTGIVNALVPSILEVTRMNLDLYYDVSSPLTAVNGSWPDEYNAQYGPNGTTPTYSQDQTYSQVIDNVSQGFLQSTVLAYAPYPLEAHIANTATYDGTHSVFSDLIDAIVTKYNNLFTLPVLSLNLDDIGGLLVSRANYNASGVVGVYTPGVSVVLTTTKAATIPVTGVCSQTSCGTYGGQIQDNVVMAAGSTVKMALPPVVGVWLSSVSVNPSSVIAGTSAMGTVTLNGAAPSGGLSVTLASDNASATVPASVTVAAGSSSATFNVSTSAVTSSVSATLSASYSGVSQSAALTIAPGVSLPSLAVSPASVIGGAAATGTVTLSSAALSGGLSVALSSNNAAATVPASVTVAAGNTTATFTVTTSTVTSSVAATLTASYSGVSQTAVLTITPAVSLSSVAVSPASVIGGSSATGTVTLNALAPAGGLAVELWTNGTPAFVPASVTIPAGSTTASFTVTTVSVSSASQATITAFYNGTTTTAPLTVGASASLSSVSVNPTTVTGGTSATGTVALSGAAPAGGIVVALWTNGTPAFVPASVTIPAGSTTASFTVTTVSVSSASQATITAFYNGASTTATLAVSAGLSLSSVSVDPTTVTGGTSATGTVTLSALAPAGGIVVDLWTNGTPAFVPTSVTIPAGSTTASFTVTTVSVSSASQDTITAFYNGASTTANVTVTP
jgi:hypothetical protein